MTGPGRWWPVSGHGHLPAAVVGGVVMWVALFWRRRHPLPVAVADRRGVLVAERARIAREFHDVIAHGLSVIAIQSDAAEQALGRDPARVGEPLRAIRATSQEALAEMRRLVGLQEALVISGQTVRSHVAHVPP